MPATTGTAASLLVDLYELTMADSYHREGLDRPATFELWVRELPRTRSFLLAAGLEDALQYLETLRFDESAMTYLERLQRFSPDFLDLLRRLRFEGDVWAMPEGTPFFAGEPVLRVTAPLIQAQLVETALLNTIQLPTMIASKAARVGIAAGGRSFVDFGARRAHGADSAIRGARASYVAGADATSLVAAGHRYGIPVTGTMAHSYVLAHDDEAAAFEAYARAHPEATVLLIDTYDTLRGARIATEVADRLRPEGIAVAGVRIDSGDLAELATGVRAILDAAGMSDTRIIASGGLDEHSIADLVGAGAPIDAFGVGTALVTSDDAPSLEIVYKLVEYDGDPVMKTSSGKANLPGVKQVLRTAAGDVLALDGEDVAGRPLLEPAVRGGRRTGPPRPLAEIRAAAIEAVAALDPALRRLGSSSSWPVTASPGLEELRRRLAESPHGTE